MIKACVYCKNVFDIPADADWRQKNKIYCSKTCCNKSFNDRFPNKLKEYRHRTYNKLYPKFCLECNKQIMDRTNGKVTCSPECRRIRNLRSATISRSQVFQSFAKWKSDIGCMICNYKRCGASLDWHHIIPEQKERRITAKHWYTKSKLIQQELDECILVCKNCHYEIHNGLVLDDLSLLRNQFKVTI